MPQFSPLYNITDLELGSGERKLGQSIKPLELSPGTGSGLIDVIGSMQFTGNDISDVLKDRIPFCILKEYELVSNSTVSQLLYYVRSLGITDDELQATGGTVSNIVQKFKDKATELQGEGNNIIKDIVGKLTEGIADQLSNIGDALSDSETLDNVLLPYNGLYARKKTGFQYVFPYFNDLKKSISTNFVESETGLLKNNAFSMIAEQGKELYQKIAGNLLAATPGAYIEQPKFFSPSDGESYRLEFNLINTVDYGKIQSHIDFLFLLAFQNLPFRKNIAEVLPPKIYSFTLPGELYIPFAYISNLTINFVGNRRSMYMRLPYIDKTDKCIVPEVYNVQLEIKALTYASANFMVADQLNKIAVIEPPPVSPTPPTPTQPQGDTTSAPDPTSQTPGTTTGGFRRFPGLSLGF